MVELNFLLQRYQSLKRQSSYIYDTLLIITFRVLMFLAELAMVLYVSIFQRCYLICCSNAVLLARS